MKVGIGKVIESASLGKQRVPDTAGNRDHLICSGADRISRKLAGRVHLVAGHSLKTEYNIWCCIVQPAQSFDRYLSAAAVVTGRVVGQDKAVGVVVLDPLCRLNCGVYTAVGAAGIFSFAPSSLLIVVIAAVGRVVEQ